MLTSIRAKDFEILGVPDMDIPNMPGTKVLEENGFDAGKCSIVVDDDGVLLVVQRGVVNFRCVPDRWKRTNVD